jgi:hypothetical protein
VPVPQYPHFYTPGPASITSTPCLYHNPPQCIFVLQQRKWTQHSMDPTVGTLHHLHVCNHINSYGVQPIPHILITLQPYFPELALHITPIKRVTTYSCWHLFMPPCQHLLPSQHHRCLPPHCSHPRAGSDLHKYIYTSSSSRRINISIRACHQIKC